MRWRFLLLCSFVVAPVLGCGDDDGGTEVGPMRDSGPRETGTPTGDMGMTTGRGVCADAPEAADLNGQFGLLASLDVSLTGRPAALVSLCPDPQTTSAELLLRIDSTQSAGSVSFDIDVCDITLPIVAGAAGECGPTNLEIAITPGAELAARLPMIPVPTAMATAATTTGGSPLAPGPFALVVGAALASPSDPLPAWDTSRAGCGLGMGGATMACVSGAELLADDDMDGRPAVTVDAMADMPGVLEGRAFVVIRVTPQLTGTIRNSNCVEGAVATSLDLSIIGSDVLLSGTPLDTPTVIQNIPPFEILPTSSFTMLRGDGEGDLDFDDDGDGTMSCAELLRHRNAFE